MKLSELKPEEKRILAAEACGIIVRKEWHGLQGWNDAQVPDYGNDLNAIHEAVEAMPYEEQQAWLDALARIADPFHGYRMHLTVEITNATAAQRLDAFLLAKGSAE